jgi:hypothetical protein
MPNANLSPVGSRPLLLLLLLLLLRTSMPIQGVNSCVPRINLFAGSLSLQNC